MNIKKWKEFSDFVDKFNDEHRTMFGMIGAKKYGRNTPTRIEKTQENYWEWTAGKLTPPTK